MLKKKEEEVVFASPFGDFPLAHTGGWSKASAPH